MKAEDKKRVHISSVPDIKSSEGKWIMTYTETTEESYICNHTRSGILWRHVKERCDPNGRVQRKYPTYVGTSHLFEDYQHFATWATSQFGYLNKDLNGKYWQLDKDLIQRGNKIYSENLCLFVPHRVNCLLTTRTLGLGESIHLVYILKPR